MPNITNAKEAAEAWAKHAQASTYKPGPLQTHMPAPTLEQIEHIEHGRAMWTIFTEQFGESFLDEVVEIARATFGPNDAPTFR